MRLVEFNNTITFKSGFVNPVTPAFTNDFLLNRLYVDDNSRAFKKWWIDPDKYFTGGGVFSIAYNGEEVVGVGVMIVPKEGRIYNVPNHDDTYVMFGKMGFFVKHDYRRSGISNTLAKKLEDAFVKAFPQYAKDGYAPVVFCSRMACSIAENQFTTIITDKELERRLERTKNEAV